MYGYIPLYRPVYLILAATKRRDKDRKNYYWMNAESNHNNPENRTRSPGMKTEPIRIKFQRIYADMRMIESLLDLVDRGKEEPDIWRAADKLLLDMVSILTSVADEFESHYHEK
jgi:hypothetical protein